MSPRLDQATSSLAAHIDSVGNWSGSQPDLRDSKLRLRLVSQPIKMVYVADDLDLEHALDGLDSALNSLDYVSDGLDDTLDDFDALDDALNDDLRARR